MKMLRQYKNIKRITRHLYERWVVVPHAKIMANQTLLKLYLFALFLSGIYIGYSFRVILSNEEEKSKGVEQVSLSAKDQETQYRGDWQDVNPTIYYLSGSGKEVIGDSWLYKVLSYGNRDSIFIIDLRESGEVFLLTGLPAERDYRCP